jgi:hypothetical protein
MSRSDLLKLACLALTATISCSSGEFAGSSQGDTEDVSTESSAVAACFGTYCAANTALNDFGGQWPDGIIYYKFDPTTTTSYRTDIRNAMNDWERMSGQTIKFCPTGTSSPPSGCPVVLSQTSSSQFPVLTVDPFGSSAAGYISCRFDPNGGGCNVHTGSTYHELGHVLGLQHTFNAYETPRYLKRTTTNNACTAYGPWGTIPTRSNLLDFGPFGYLSTMMYSEVRHPEMTRWNDSVLMPGASCGPGAGGAGGTWGIFPNPPGCTGTWCVPTCAPCNKTQPQGFPTFTDGANVAEYYRNLSDPAWHKFMRTVEEDLAAPNVPFNYALATNVSIPATASPAVAYEPSTTFASVWVRGTGGTSGTDGTIFMKTRSAGNWMTGAWLNWVDLGAPSGSGAVSDPAVVSWAAGRYDLVAKRGSNVYIRTYQNNAWGSWQSLGAPSGLVPSTPAITSWGPNRLDVFVRGSDDKLYWRKSTVNCSGASGVWSSWTAVGSSQTFRGKPAAVSRSSGLISVFAHSPTGKVIAINKDATETWSSWAELTNPGGSSTRSLPNAMLKWDSSCSSCSSPAAGSRLGGIDVYVRGDDDKIWISSWSPNDSSAGFSTFAALGGSSIASPGAVTMGANDNLAKVVITTAEEYTRPTNESPVFRNGVWMKEYDASHTYPSQVALAPNSDGRLEAVYTGVHDVLYVKYQDSTFGWNGSLLNFIGDRAQRVAIGRNLDGRLDVLKIAPNGIIRHSVQQNGPGNGYGLHDAPLNATSTPASDMAIASNSDGRLHAVYVGTNGTLYQTAQSTPNGAWNGEQLLDQPFSAGKRIALERNTNTNRLEAIFIGSNDVVHFARQTSAGASTWTVAPISSPTVSAKRIALARNSQGRLEIAFIALNDVLYHAVQNSDNLSWGTAHLLAQSTTTGRELAMTLGSNSLLEVLFADTNYVLQRQRQQAVGGATWSGGVLLTSAVTAKQLALSRDSSNRLVAAFVGLDDRLWRTQQSAANSTTWTTPAFFGNPSH